MIAILNPFEKKTIIDAIPLGIDLGTTHTLATYYTPEEGVKFITWHDGSKLLPSIVSFKQNSVGIDPEFVSTKRFMTEATRILKDDKTALDVATAILSYVKKIAQEQLQKPIAHVVITVPAYFDDAARQATKTACERAGLVVRRIINEPTAAALAYGIEKEGIYAVYDFGGGTFDLSVLRMQRGVFQVLSTIGDLNLGGDDIDAKILEFWGKDDSYRAEAKKEKEIASLENFQEIVKPFIDRTLKLSEKGLRDARVTHLDGVILVGGSTRLSGLHPILKAFFKAPLFFDKNPDLIVAEGAAIQSYALLHGANHVLIDVNPLSIGLETMGGLVEKIIPRNTPLPTTKEQIFTTYVDGQTAIEFNITQGEREFAKDNRSLAKFTLSNITPLPKGEAKIKVEFHIDSDGLLYVEAMDLLTSNVVSTEVRPTFGLSKEEIRSLVLEAQINAKTDVEQQMLLQKTMEAEKILKAASTYKYKGEAVQKLEQAIINRNTNDMDKYTEMIIEALRPRIEEQIVEQLKEALVGRKI